MSEVSMSRPGAVQWLGPRYGARIRERVARLQAHRATASRRQTCAILGIIAPALLLAGIGDSVHELAWYVYYGLGPNMPTGVAAGAMAWLAWGVVLGFALLGWRLLAATAAWLTIAGMALSIATFATIPTPYMGAWFLLAAIAALALTFSPRRSLGGSLLPKRSVLKLLAAVAAVVFVKLLGHQFALLYLLVWIGLGVLVVRTTRQTRDGRRAIVLLAAPVACAVCIAADVRWFRIDPILFGGNGPGLTAVLAQLYVAPVVVLCLSWLALRRWELRQADGGR